LVALVPWFVATAGAAPIFSSVTLDTNTVAVAGGNADADSDSSPPSAAPLITESIASDTGADASAGALADEGLLFAVAESISTGGIAVANAESHFVGTFTNTPRLSLSFDLFSLAGAIDAGVAALTLYVQLISNGNVIFDQFYDSTSAFSLYFEVPSSSINMLDLRLVAESSALDTGSAQGFGTVTVSAVPLPGTLLLLLAGLGVLGWVTRGSRPVSSLTPSHS
jgi:hypothetical protein